MLLLKLNTIVDDIDDIYGYLSVNYNLPEGETADINLSFNGGGKMECRGGLTFDDDTTTKTCAASYTGNMGVKVKGVGKFLVEKANLTSFSFKKPSIPVTTKDIIGLDKVANISSIQGYGIVGDVKYLPKGLQLKSGTMNWGYNPELFGNLESVIETFAKNATAEVSGNLYTNNKCLFNNLSSLNCYIKVLGNGKAEVYSDSAYSNKKAEFNGSSWSYL